ncbi:MAG TPA: LytTR family transcriptional regulator DNA-binding domain-containing protein [Anaerolineales bacterium]|nr:LytTR family transcriptional regulator DNA-binding domain-containing protein [Anaerolineales bacterium]
MIQLKNLQKAIDGSLMIDIPALEVEGQEIAALVGPAGSGKRALFDLFTGKTRPTAGTVRMVGIDPFQDKDQFSQVAGALFAEDAVYKHLSPLRNLEFQARLYGLPRSRASEVLSRVGLGDQANAKLDKLSTSLLRRLAFGRAILHSPRVLLLFEPFSRCDQITVGLLSSLMRSIAEGGNATLILANDLTNLDSLCDRLHILNQGRITESHQPQEEQAASLPFKIPARLGDKKVILLNPADILYAYAGEGRAFLVTPDGELPSQFTLAELEERLGRSGFFRAHRGFLVNLQHVKEVIPFTRNSFSLRLNDAASTEIPLSKTAARELSELLGY